MTINPPQFPPETKLIKPQEGPQTEFLTCGADVIFYGGSAGGGKTYALLLDPLYHIHNPKFKSVIFRRTTKQITVEGGLWDTSLDLYSQIGGIPIQSPHYHHRFPVDDPDQVNIPSVNFHHMEYEKNRYDWQGSQIPDIKFDELTHFTWSQFNYMLSRNRSDSGVKGTIKATCNPDPDHFVRKWVDWYIGEDGFAIPDRSGVIRWFIIAGDELVWASTPRELIEQYPHIPPKSFTFIRSSVFDNKILLENDPAYLANLHALTRVEKARLLEGNWDVRPSAGSYFKRGEFPIVDGSPANAKRVRAWDLAATQRPEPASQKERKADDPDYTAGVRMSEYNGIYYVEHVERFRIDAPLVIGRIKNMAVQDNSTYKRQVKVRFPQDPGQAGKSQAKSFTSHLAGHSVVHYPVTGSKEHRATPFASQVQAGNVRLVRGPWNESFLIELENFPEGVHDDQVDAASDAFDELSNPRRVGTW